jgi:tetratricopeptide (TPR) repeat protein
MRKPFLPVLLLFVAFCAQATVALPDAHRPQSPEAEADATRTAIRDAFFNIRNNDWDAAAAAFDAAIHSRGFATLPEDLRYPALLTAGQIAERAEKYALAHALLEQATHSSQADAPAWHERLSAAYALSDHVDSGLCVTTIARRWPRTLDQINSSAIYVLERRLGESPDTGNQMAMLQALFDAHWISDEGEPSDFWRDLALLHLGKRDIDQAKIVAARVRSARVALIMRVDKRFDALTQGNPGAFDIDRIAAAELETARANAKAAPDTLRPLTTLQGVLLDLRQFDEVVAIGDAVIARSAAGAGKSAYVDYDDRYIWVLDQRSRALAALGRSDEAIAQWKRSARHPENGEVNVSQVLNLGAYYADLQRPEDALDMVSELGPMSPYGRMQLEMVRLVAAIDQTDTAATATHLAFMREHRGDAIATWQSALLMSGDLDAAADLLVERLRTEKWRGGALEDMQDYAGTETTPMAVQRQARWKSILARPNVLKALEKVGRIERFNLASQQI